MLSIAEILKLSIPELMTELGFTVPQSRFQFIEDISVTEVEREQAIAGILPYKIQLITKMGIQVHVSEIDIYETDKNHVLYQIKMDKYMEYHDTVNKLKEQERRAEILRPWSTDELIEVALRRAHEICASTNKKFVMDGNAANVWKILSMYFSNDKRFEQAGEGFSLDKSICIIGDVGCGKTTMLRAFEKNKKQCFRFFPCEQISVDARNAGDDGLANLGKFTKLIPAGGEGVFFQSHIGWLLDDLGREVLINDYGTKVEPMVHILSQHYNRLETKKPLCFHTTSNMDPDEIQNRYGRHIRSRFRLLYNTIFYNGEDRR